MALDLDFTPYYTLKLPLSENVVNYRPYLIGEEISFLTHIETEETKALINSLINLTKNCVKEKEVFDNMNVIDFTYLTANIRGKSKGEEIELTHSCPDCDKPLTSIFDVSKDLKIKNKENRDMIVDVSNNIKVQIDVLPYTHILEMLNLDDDSVVDYVTIASCIKKIIVNGEIYSKLTINEVYNDFIKKLSSKQLKIITNEMKRLPKIYGELNFSCGCGHNSKIEVDNILNFLV